RSQMALLSAKGDVVEIAALTVHRLTTPSGHLSIVSEEAGRPDAPPPWLMLESVPAGAYELDVSTTRPRAGELLVYTDGGSEPIQRLHLKPLSRQTLSLMLPAAAFRLVILPDASLDKVSGRIAL